MIKKNLMTNNEGMTLVEVVMTIVILSIFVTLVFSLYQIGNKMTIKGGDRYNTQSEAKIVTEKLLREVRWAYDVTIMTVADAENEIADLGVSSGYHYIVIRDGNLYKSQYNATGPRVTESLSRWIVAEGSSFGNVSSSSNLLTMVIDIEYKNESYVLDSEIELMNIVAIGYENSRFIQGISNAKAIKYKIPTRESMESFVRPEYMEP